MIDINRLSPNLRNDILSQKGWDGLTDATAEQKLALMDLYDAFDAFLCYNGIIGFTSEIIMAWEQLREAEVARPVNVDHTPEHEYHTHA